MAAIPTKTLQTWTPEDPVFWRDRGAPIARRTLWITTGALTLSFATWFMWSVIVVRLPGLGFQLSVGQRFWLVALPGLVGATLRIPYSFVVQIFGTRNVITWGTASLLVPAIAVGIAVQHPETPFWVMALIAASAGFGGGNFSAFMPSTSLFYPKKRQGTALGVQAGVGNFGVSLVQFLTPLVIGASLFGGLGGEARTWMQGGAQQSLWIQNAAFIWVVPVLFFTAAAAFGLRSIPTKANLREQAVIFKRKHNWLMTSLYFMTFGTFSGFSAAFALLIRELFFVKFPGGPDPLKYAFLGALIGSAMRPIGGWISDKIGGAKVTMVSGALLLASTIFTMRYTTPTSVAQFTPFLVGMLGIFFASGIGNGSTFRMIPVIFPAKEAAPVLGWTAAIAAYGSFVIPMAISWAMGRFGSPNFAFGALAVFFAVNLGVCWWFYARKGAEAPC